MPNNETKNNAKVVEVKQPGFLKRNWKKILVGTAIIGAAAAGVIGGKKFLDSRSSEAEF